MSSSDNLQLSAWHQPPGELDFERADKWYLGEHFHRFPIDRPIEIEDVTAGWKPPAPFIENTTRVLAFGSCFAEYFIRFLSNHGYNKWQLPVEKHGFSDESLLLSLGQSFENIFVIVQQLRWAFHEFTPTSALWFTKDKHYFEATEERRENIRRSFEQLDVLVITLGLSEVWWDQAAGEPMWRPITARYYDPLRHVFKKTTVAENLSALWELHRLAAQFLPGRRIIFTLSPIPLLATFRDQSPITANAASKATLRAALDEFFSAQEIRESNLYYYFPSYELAMSLFGNPFEADNRHVRPEVAKLVLGVFSTAYTDLPHETMPQIVPAETSLRHEVLRLRQSLEEKEAVITELARAAEERLAVINSLQQS